MTFKPMTYFVSFSLFVMLFMGLGGYVGYRKIADHLRVQAFLEARPMAVQVLDDPQGPRLRWDEQLSLARGGVVRIAARDRLAPVSIAFSDAAAAQDLPLAAHERLEDLRVDRGGRRLYARVFAASKLKSEELTWLYTFDLQDRRLLRRIAVNPILLPAPVRP